MRGISQNTFYKWRTQYGGMNMDEARKLKALLVENAQLKKLVADLSLNILSCRMCCQKMMTLSVPLQRPTRNAKRSSICKAWFGPDVTNLCRSGGPVPSSACPVPVRESRGL